MIPYYICYTDGAYSPKSKQGGIGIVILKDDVVAAKHSKSFKDTTNQRMELTAAITALKAIKKPSNILIISDSMYVVKAFEWKHKSNLDLWEEFDKYAKFHKSVKTEWIKGHDTNQYNIMCDKLAQKASKELM